MLRNCPTLCTSLDSARQKHSAPLQSLNAYTHHVHLSSHNTKCHSSPQVNPHKTQNTKLLSTYNTKFTHSVSTLCPHHTKLVQNISSHTHTKSTENTSLCSQIKLTQHIPKHSCSRSPPVRLIPDPHEHRSPPYRCLTNNLRHLPFMRGRLWSDVQRELGFFQ